MFTRYPAFVLPLLLLAVCAVSAQSDSDLTTLREFKVEPNVASILEYFKKRTPAPETIQKVDQYISELGDDEYTIRESATKGLINIGPLSRGKLASAVKSEDPEVRRRAKYALDRISVPADDNRLLPAAVRVLAARKAENAAEVVLNLLPHIESQDTIDDIAAELPALAVDKEGKPVEAILKALSSKNKVLRGAAGVALAKAAGAEENRALVRKLMADPEIAVRRRVIIALVYARDAKALPELVALTGNPSEDDAAIAEDLLYTLAGEKAPEGIASDEKDPRGATQKIWEKWLKEDGAKLDLAKVDFANAGSNLILIGSMDLRAGVGAGRVRTGLITAIDASGKERWKLDKVAQYPTHAVLTRRDRVLVTEFNYNRVQEYDLKGNVVWSYTPPTNPIASFRLRNGNTFVAMRNSLILMDADKKVLRTINRAAHDISAAYITEDGRVSIMTQSGVVIRYDRDGKEVSSINTGRPTSGIIGTRVQFNPDGSFVVPDYSNQRVRMFDKDGKQRWEATVANWPTSVIALPGGNYLVGHRNGTQMTELDRNGKEVKKRPSPGTQTLFLERR
jgi:HEAT repeat protein